MEYVGHKHKLRDLVVGLHGFEGRRGACSMFQSKWQRSCKSMWQLSGKSTWQMSCKSMQQMSCKLTWQKLTWQTSYETWQMSCESIEERSCS